MMKAVGEFVVTLKPLDAYTSGSSGIRLDRMSIDKSFSGDLIAASRGEMLSARAKREDSAGYVALEQVEGVLMGRQGSFVLQHFATLRRGEQRLVLEVVPDSGTGELEGLSGTMTIRIEAGKHFYEFAYSLGE